MIQGDGGVVKAFARMVDDTTHTYHVGASRTPTGCVGTVGNLVCDYTGPLTTIASDEAASDGEDYIEGNAGNDVIFGNLGQDDIVGGSSNFFSLVTPDLRPDGLPDHDSFGNKLRNDYGDRGADIIFGGAGSRAGQNDDSYAPVASATVAVTSVTSTTLTRTVGSWIADGFAPLQSLYVDGVLIGTVASVTATVLTMTAPFAGVTVATHLLRGATGLDVAHNRDADTIVSDNGQIIRIVGINHIDGDPTGSPTAAMYVTFNWDNYGAMREVVRGVTLLDYTVGGPDFRPDLFFKTGTGDCNGSPTQPTCTPVWTPTCANCKYVDIGGSDEVHGESGDDTVYTGAGNDIIFG
ncbi:MAG TPA: hypothetical protein VKJ07_10860, partial [Mycobacteriales bacterium]|nr:hypothetical protein [Mycobacteriales bacterium]